MYQKSTGGSTWTSVTVRSKFPPPFAHVSGWGLVIAVEYKLTIDFLAIITCKSFDCNFLQKLFAILFLFNQILIKSITDSTNQLISLHIELIQQTTIPTKTAIFSATFW